MNLLSAVKSAVVPGGRSPRRILSGPFKGLVMDLDLKHQFQVYAGTFERETYPFLWRLSRGIASAIEVGAAEGEYCLFFATRTSARPVFAFEPIEECRVRLRRNLMHNGIDASRLRLSGQLVGAENSERFCTLDSLLPSLTFPCFVKMDIDGGEAQALRGATGLLERDTRWLVETHSLALERECQQVLDRAGFVTHIVPNAWWRIVLPELRGGEQNRWLVATRTPV